MNDDDYPENPDYNMTAAEEEISEELSRISAEIGNLMEELASLHADDDCPDDWRSKILDAIDYLDAAAATL